MSTVAIYARYSSEQQSERSIEDQIAACEIYARQRGLAPPFKLYSDAALSGSSMATRPGLLSLLEAIRARAVDTVIAESIDRLSRDQADIHLIRRLANTHAVKLITIADGEVTSMIAGLKGIMAEAYLIDLADKTRRGLKGVTRSGRIAGGLCYGYRTIPGKPGEREIDAAQADVVREIFQRYVDGDTRYRIAGDLNRRGEPGPRGGKWTVNAIYGDARIGDGVLCQPLYRGQIIYNRRRFVKDPETGGRSSVLNPESEWLRADAPHLRIVDDAIWERVQAMRTRVAGAAPIQNRRRRPARLFSGLIRCAACDGLMTIENRGRLLCANAGRGTGVCDVRERLPVAVVEGRVIAGIQRCLLSPDAIGEAVRAYHAERAANQKTDAVRRARLASDIETQRRRVDRIAEHLIEAAPGSAHSTTLKAKLTEAEAALAAMDADLAAMADADTAIVAVHPNASQAYRAKVASLSSALDDGAPDTIKRAVRGLVERIDVTPDANAADGWAITLHGQLAALLALGAQANAQKATPGVSAGGSFANTDAMSADLGRSSVGAGAGFEPTTFRL